MKILPPKKPKEITPEKMLFVTEYLKDCSPMKAMMRVRPGITKGGASSMARLYLSQECVQRELTKIIHKAEESAEVTVAEIIKELHMIAKTDINDAFYPDHTMKPLHEMPVALRRAISSAKFKGPTKEDISYTVEIKLWEKTKALELLGKHLAMWMDKLQLSGDFIVEFGHRRQKPIDITAQEME
jgi:phage terminase small subunit